MAGARYQFTMATQRVDALSRQVVGIGVSAYLAGYPLDPTSKTAEVAFLPGSRTKPDPGDWNACAWDTTVIRAYVAQCMVGPGGTAELAPGRYYTWIRITDETSDEEHVEQVGMLFVD